MYDGENLYFGADHVNMWCGSGYADLHDSPDYVRTCPFGTNTIEVSRSQADRDQFRLRCYK